MDREKIGALLRQLRLERGMTQKEAAHRLQISDKTISKWERGLGCPDISMLPSLSALFGVPIEKLLAGNLPTSFLEGNMKKSKYFVCPHCGNLTLTTGDASITCCGRSLEPMTAKKAEESEKFHVEIIENDWFLTTDHPMEKENYISFVAFATGDKVQLYKQYPEWDLQLRIPKRGHGTLFWYSTTKGFFYQYL